jgi:threonyl-tRNA synthetase
LINGTSHSLSGSLNSLKLPKETLFAKVRYRDPLVGVKLTDPDQLEDAQESADWKLTGLQEPILGDCEATLASFEDPVAQSAFWHSSAHILGYAIEQVYENSLLTIGPSIKDGFFYDFEGAIVRGEEDYKNLEKSIKGIINKNYEFERLLLTKEQALDMFSYNRFKVELISKKVPDGDFTSVYKIGDFIDLCTGPHIPSTKHAQAFKIMKHSQAYWLGDSNRDSLQRVYGISFPSKEQLAHHL